MHVASNLNSKNLLPTVPTQKLLEELSSNPTKHSKRLLKFLEDLPDNPCEDAPKTDEIVETVGGSLINWLVGLLSEPTRLNVLGSPIDSSPRFKNGIFSAWESLSCLADEVRTKRFSQATLKAIVELEQIKSGPIHVLDAGCGAFPLYAILACLSSERAVAVAVEIDPTAVKIAREFVEIFGLTDRIKVVQADAATFIPEYKFDLAISETMHHAITDEGIVAIFQNLANYSSDNCIFIPSRINLKLGLFEPTKSGVIPNYKRLYLGQYHEQRSTIGSIQELGNFSWSSRDELPLISLKGQVNESVAEKDNTGHIFLVITTEIDLYPDISLKVGDSVLTSFASLGFWPQGKRAVKVEYKPGIALDRIRPIFS